jgi:hypothetical protein
LVLHNGFPHHGISHGNLPALFQPVHYIGVAERINSYGPSVRRYRAGEW